ncbi:hypothetical protein DFH27DRAFT_524184 [Peziza echinospora]|nr:hypothetical protein DFH27DRAFT_524184 [Peziza echinospora]
MLPSNNISILTNLASFTNPLTAITRTESYVRSTAVPEGRQRTMNTNTNKRAASPEPSDQTNGAKRRKVEGPEEEGSGNVPPGESGEGAGEMEVDGDGGGEEPLPHEDAAGAAREEEPLLPLPTQEHLDGREPIDGENTLETVETRNTLAHAGQAISENGIDLQESETARHDMAPAATGSAGEMEIDGDGEGAIPLQHEAAAVAAREVPRLPSLQEFLDGIEAMRRENARETIATGNTLAHAGQAIPENGIALQESETAHHDMATAAAGVDADNNRDDELHDDHAINLQESETARHDMGMATAPAGRNDDNHNRHDEPHDEHIAANEQQWYADDEYNSWDDLESNDGYDSDATDDSLFHPWMFENHGTGSGSDSDTSSNYTDDSLFAPHMFEAPVPPLSEEEYSHMYGVPNGDGQGQAQTQAQGSLVAGPNTEENSAPPQQENESGGGGGAGLGLRGGGGDGDLEYSPESPPWTSDSDEFSHTDEDTSDEDDNIADANELSTTEIVSLVLGMPELTLQSDRDLTKPEIWHNASKSNNGDLDDEDLVPSSPPPPYDWNPAAAPPPYYDTADVAQNIFPVRPFVPKHGIGLELLLASFLVVIIFISFMLSHFY